MSSKEKQKTDSTKLAKLGIPTSKSYVSKAGDTTKLKTKIMAKK